MGLSVVRHRGAHVAYIGPHGDFRTAEGVDLVQVNRFVSIALYLGGRAVVEQGVDGNHMIDYRGVERVIERPQIAHQLAQ